MTRIIADWLTAPAPRAVCAALHAGGAQALFVGGCVRNALLGEQDSDIDISTDATPEEVIKLAGAAGLKVVPTGIDHGTITVVSDSQGFEVTTFRRDVETDGRHAVVTFSRDIAEDAARRDFTMNALYAQADGTVLDPLGGLEDLRARRLRFIGDAKMRICEDYLRTLRFFRFHAWYADATKGFDPDALAAIAMTLDGLAGLSRERVGSEIVKLLSAPDPAAELAVMMQVGVLQALLPGVDPRAIGPLVHLEQQVGLSPDPMRRLAALGGRDLRDALRLSKTQTTRLAILHEAATGMAGPDELGYSLKSIAQEVLVLRAALMEQPLDMQDLDCATHAALQKLPLSPRHLMPDYSGKALGDRLKQVEKAWISSGFTLTRGQLLDLPRLPD